MRSESFEGSWQEFLVSRDVTAEHFQPIFDRWDERYAEYAVTEMRPDASRGLIDPSRDLDPDTDPLHVEPGLEDQPIRQFTLEDDIIPALNEIGRAPGGGSGVVEEMLSVASSGEVFLETNLFKKWALHQGKNLMYAPFSMGLNQLIGLLPQGDLINTWLNVGLAAWDLLGHNFERNRRNGKRDCY